MVVGARQTFKCFIQKKPDFHENNRALYKFLYGILNDLISITKSF